MTSRSIITAGFGVLCVAALWGVLGEGRQLSQLRAEQKRLNSGNAVISTPAAVTIPTTSPAPEVPRELLQLRAEVAQLSQQQRELAGARMQNEQLRQQVETRRTNRAPANMFGAAFLRKSETKWRGYGTPEDTLQSFFWAIQNQDMEKLLQALQPQEMEDFKRMIQQAGPDKFFKQEDLPPGFAIVGREVRSDGSVELKAQISPDIPAESFLFQQIEGQWKMGKLP